MPDGLQYCLRTAVAANDRDEVIARFVTNEIQAQELLDWGTQHPEWLKAHPRTVEKIEIYTDK